MQAEYINKQLGEQGAGGALQRERKALPNEQYPGQFEQGTAAAEGVDAPTNAGNALPEGMGKPENDPDVGKKMAEQGQQPDGAADLQRQAERKEADEKLKSAQNLPSGGNAKTNDGKTNDGKK